MYINYAKKRCTNRYFICFSTCLFLSSMVASADNRQQTSYEFSGLAFNISTIAFIDFSKKLESYSMNGLEVEVFLSKIESYQLKFESENSVYLVTFLPKPFKGVQLKGGGAFYEINKQTLAIAKKIYYK